MGALYGTFLRAFFDVNILDQFKIKSMNLQKKGKETIPFLSLGSFVLFASLTRIFYLER